MLSSQVKFSADRRTREKQYALDLSMQAHEKILGIIKMGIFSFWLSIDQCHDIIEIRLKIKLNILLGECNTILSAYTKYRHLG